MGTRTYSTITLKSLLVVYIITSTCSIVSVSKPLPMDIGETDITVDVINGTSTSSHHPMAGRKPGKHANTTTSIDGGGGGSSSNEQADLKNVGDRFSKIIDSSLHLVYGECKKRCQIARNIRKRIKEEQSKSAAKGKDEWKSKTSSELLKKQNYFRM